MSTVAVGAGTLAGPLVPTASAVTDEDLSFANFGAAGELLLKDFYSQALEAKLLRGPGYRLLRQGRSAAARHARALSALLEGAGDTPPAEEDFAFTWPARTFRTADSILSTALGVLRALQGSYETGAVSASVESYRVALLEPRRERRPADRRLHGAVPRKRSCTRSPSHSTSRPRARLSTDTSARRSL